MTRGAGSRAAIASLVLGLLLALTGVAVAQPAPPASPSIEQSRKLYEQATDSYRLGKFEEALAGYEAAYQLYRAPQFLFNIAQCHFQLQRWDRAVFFFEGYLRELPGASNRSLVEELIEEARQRRAAQQEAERQQLQLEQERLELERARARRVEEQARLALAPRPVEIAPARPVYKQWWFWSLVGGALAGVAVTAAVAGGDPQPVLPAGSLGTWDRR